MQFTPKLGSNSDLTRVQSWTTLVQRALRSGVASTRPVTFHLSFGGVTVRCQLWSRVVGPTLLIEYQAFTTYADDCLRTDKPSWHITNSMANSAFHSSEKCFSTFLLPQNPEQAWRSLMEPHALIRASSDVREVEATGCLRTHFPSRAEPLWGRQSKQRWPILNLTTLTGSSTLLYLT